MQIHDLPDEVLHDIFIHLVKEEFYGKHIDPPSHPVIYPWLFVEVCRRWKDICLQSANLWGYFNWGGHECSRDSDAQYNPAPLLRTYIQLERSKKALLDVDLDGLCSCASQVSIFRALAEHCQRWRSLLCDYKTNALQPDFVLSLFSPCRKFTSLTEVGWSCDNDAGGGIDPLCKWIGSEVQSIRSATFVYPIVVARSMVSSTFPWETLTTLVLDTYHGTVDDLLELLSHCNNLMHLKLYGEGYIEEDEDSIEEKTEVVILEHMTSLKVNLDARPDMSRLLGHIQAPNIHELSYTSRIPSDSLDTFVKFLSLHSLTKLQLLCPSKFNVQHLEIFRVSNYLQHLVLHAQYSLNHTDCDGFLHVMVEEGRKMCPRLEHLELRSLDFDPVLLTQFAESRIASEEDSPMDDGDMTASVQVQLSLTIANSGWEMEKASRLYCKTVLEKSLEKYTKNRSLRLRFINK